MESARYGEADIARALLRSDKSGKLINHVSDSSGNTALHMAAANGHVEVVNLLLHHHHPHRKNDAGNTPLHWASSNGQSEVVQILTTNKELEVDVLEKNEFGRSALTEGFTSQQEAVVKSLLEHDSAAEDKLLSSSNTSGKGEHMHELFEKESPLRVRELAITNADNPFADADRPDQDTTGLSIWAASLVMARWMKTLSWDRKTVVELGAGCGVPGLAVASSVPSPEMVYLTDLNPNAVDNLSHNIELNNLTNASAIRTDWSDKETWPGKKVDFVIGSDLIYQKELIPLLTQVILGMVKPGGTFYYVAPDTGRAGLENFITEMKRMCPMWKEKECPVEYLRNPLADQDDELCYLHFQELSTLNFVLYEFSIEGDD